MDVVALSAVLVSGVVGVAGTVATTWTTRQSMQLTRENRKQQRIEDAYLKVLAGVEAEGQWAGAHVRALIEASDPDARYQPPSLTKPTPDDRPVMAARIGAFGSTEVKQAYAKWLDAIAKIEEEHARLIWELEQDGDPWARSSWNDLQSLATTLIPAEKVARDALSERIAAELGHR
jgi:hypothetical protein